MPNVFKKLSIKKRAQDVEYLVVEEVSMAGICHYETLLDVRAGTHNGPG